MSVVDDYSEFALTMEEAMKKIEDAGLGDELEMLCKALRTATKTIVEVTRENYHLRHIAAGWEQDNKLLRESIEDKFTLPNGITVTGQALFVLYNALSEQHEALKNRCSDIGIEPSFH